nr:response regulator [Candidatus Dadabacteria bacterium]
SVGHNVDIYENGELVLDAIENNVYDLIILDMFMPVLDGVEAVKIYKFMKPTREQIPIIILTANATLDAENLCKEIGVNAYMTKPIKRELLIKTIQSVTNQKKLHFTDTNKPKLKLVHNKTNEEKAIIDLPTLNNLAILGDNPKFISELIHGFLTDSLESLKVIQTAITHNNFHTVVDLSHAIKGSSQSIGANALADIASKIHKSALNSDKANLEHQYRAFQDIYSKTQIELTSYLENLNIAAL